MTDLNFDNELTLRRLLDPEVLRNPYPYYHRLRTADPVHWDIFMQAWVLTRYDDVVRVLRTFSAARTPTPEQLEDMGLGEMRIIAELTNNQMLFSDPPRHTRFRSLTAAAFTPRSIARLRESIARVVDEILCRIQGNEFDVVADYAALLPGIITARMLGVPEEDHARLRQWSSDFSEAFGTFHYDPERTPEIIAACKDVCEYFRECVHHQRRVSGDGIIHSLMTASIEGDKLSETEVIANCIVIMVGGLETTTSLIANGLYSLLQIPAQFNIIRKNLNVMPAVVEELLRYDSPVQHTARIAPADVEIRVTGVIRSVPLCRALITGEDPAACAEWILKLPSLIRPTSFSSLKALATLGRIVPPAVGTTILCGRRHPSCSAISKPKVLAPSV